MQKTKYAMLGRCVDRSELHHANIVSRIAKGESPELVLVRAMKLFKTKSVKRYAYTIYEKPIVGGPDVQQFHTIIGTVWAEE